MTAPLATTDSQDQNQSSDPQLDNPPQPPAPTSPPIDYASQLASMQQVAQDELRRSQRLQEQLDAMQRQQSRPASQSFNYDDMNQRMGNGQTAQTIDEIVRARQQETLAPIMEEFTAARRERSVGKLLDRVILNRPQLPGLVQYRNQLLQSLLDSDMQDPTFSNVEMVVDAVIGRAIQNNPSLLTQQYGLPSNPNPAPTMQDARSPIPPQVPSGRPAPANRATQLTESEKRMKAIQDPDNRLSPEEFKAALYNQDSEFVFDITAPQGRKS